jgi:hypothetical protein
VRVRLADRTLPVAVGGLAHASRVLAWGARWNFGSRSEDESRHDGLPRLLTQLASDGWLDDVDDPLGRSSDIILVPTGSSVAVAMLPATADRKAAVLKYTDSDIAGSEIAAASEAQRMLRGDERFASWAHYVPDVLASGKIGTTTFTLEECLSRRDGRAVGPDWGNLQALIADALVVIDQFHRLTARRQTIGEPQLAVIVDRPAEIVRRHTSAGLSGSRHRALDRLSSWLRASLDGRELNVGRTHGDFHLGNVLLADQGQQIVGVIDWGRTEDVGLTVLDGFTLIVLETARRAGAEFGPFVLQLLRESRVARRDGVHGDVLIRLERLLGLDTGGDLSALLLLTWLAHVAGNLNNEDRARSHVLWSLQNVDLVLYRAIEILGAQ